MTDSLIIRPFNGLFLGVFALFAVVFLVLSLVQRKHTEHSRRILLSAIMIFATLCYFIYKVFLSLDTDYSAITEAAGIGAFSWWSELPLQLCNINLILIPIACLTKNRSLESFCFFTAPLGAAMALTMPCAGFECYSLLLPRVFGFYFTHFMVFFGGIALASFNIYRPKFRDLFRTVLLALFLTLGIFCINLLMRVTGVNPHANYFYCVETEGNFILELFYSWLPYPFVYMLPCSLILVPYMLIITALFQIRGKKKAPALENA